MGATVSLKPPCADSAKEAAAAKKKRRKKKARGRTSDTLSVGASAGDDGDQESILSSSACIESANGHDSDSELPGTPAISEHLRQAGSTPHGHISDFERHLGPSSSGEIPPALGSDDGSSLHGLAKGRSCRVSFDEGPPAAYSLDPSTRDLGEHGPGLVQMDGKLPEGCRRMGASSHSRNASLDGGRPAATKPAGQSLPSSTGADGGGLVAGAKTDELDGRLAVSVSKVNGQAPAAAAKQAKSQPADPLEPVRKALDDAITQAAMLLDIGLAAGEDTIEHVSEVSSSSKSPKSRWLFNFGEFIGV